LLSFIEHILKDLSFNMLFKPQRQKFAHLKLFFFANPENCTLFLFINPENCNLFGGFALAKLRLFKPQNQKVAIERFIFQYVV